MKFAKEQLTLTSNGNRVSYHNITQKVKDFVERSQIKNGICLVQSPHTTCSVIFEEFMHDTDFNGDEILQVDLNRMLDLIVPRELSERRKYRMSLDDPNYPTDPATILNGDAHIRSSFFGASESFILHEGKLEIGSVGYIYFVDFDQNRVRNRTCHLMLMGE